MSSKRKIKEPEEPAGSSDRNRLKVGVFGGLGAGKTGLVMRIVQNAFVEDIEEFDYYEDRWNCMLGDTHLQVLKSCSMDEYVVVIKAYARAAHAALLLVDTTNESSLEDAKLFVEVFAEVRDPVHNPLPLVVVGTKTDLESERKLTPEEVKAFADTLSAPYIETSAKTGQGVREAFAEAARQTTIVIGNDNAELEGEKDKRCAIQ